MPLEFTGHSIFLAGPTPRSTTVKSWRIKAIQELFYLNYTGTVLIPERRDWNVKFDYLDQVEWEDAGLERASKICFWVPRTFPDMLALTTNVEFGRWVERRRSAMTDVIVYGRPSDAIHCKYLDWLYYKVCGKLPYTDLIETLKEATL